MLLLWSDVIGWPVEKETLIFVIFPGEMSRGDEAASNGAVFTEPAEHSFVIHFLETLCLQAVKPSYSYHLVIGMTRGP